MCCHIGGSTYSKRFHTREKSFMTKNNIYFYNKTNGSQDSSTRRPTKDHLQLEDPIRIREVQNIGIQLLEKNEKQLKYAT